MAEPWDRSAPRRWLGGQGPLPPVVPVQAIAVTEVLPEVDRPAILIDGSRAGTDESRRAVRVDEVRTRDQVDQPSNDRVGCRCTLLVAQHQAVHVEALSLPETVVGGEEVSLCTNERTAREYLEIVALEGVRVGGRELEEVARVHRVVAQEPEYVAVQVVAARPRDDVDDRPGHVSVLGAEHRVVNLEFLHARHGRLEENRAERQVVRGHAVDVETNSLL